MHKIKFIPDSHQYITEDGQEMISVSAFTDRFKQKVDWEAVARKVALKQIKAGIPTTTKEVLAKWERKRNLSANIGTLYHDIREKQLLETDKPVFYNIPCETRECSYSGSEKWSIPINQLSNNTVYPELMIYDFEHMLCGQSDKVIVTNNKINIWDYKTDLEIKFNAYSSQWVKAARFLEPLKHLEECNGNLYSLKMSLYMYMLWNSNRGKLKPGDIIIEHVHLERDSKNDNIPILKEGRPIVKKIEQIQLPYRKKEVIDMLATLKVKS